MGTPPNKTKKTFPPPPAQCLNPKQQGICIEERRTKERRTNVTNLGMCYWPGVLWDSLLELALLKDRGNTGQIQILAVLCQCGGALLLLLQQKH